MEIAALRIRVGPRAAAQDRRQLDSRLHFFADVSGIAKRFAPSFFSPFFLQMQNRELVP